MLCKFDRVNFEDTSCRLELSQQSLSHVTLRNDHADSSSHNAQEINGSGRPRREESRRGADATADEDQRVIKKYLDTCNVRRGVLILSVYCSRSCHCLAGGIPGFATVE